MKSLKNRIKAVAIAGVVLAMSVGLLALVFNAKAVQAQPVAGNQYYNPILVVNSAGAPGTNAHFGISSNGYYPISLIGGDVMTNMAAKADVSQYREISIQVSASPSATTGAAAAQTVTFTIYRSLSGGSSTNWAGGNLLFDTLGTITLTNIASSTGPWTVISNYCNGPSPAVPLGGVTTLYVGKLDATGLTNGVYLTNYSVRISGK